MDEPLNVATTVYTTAPKAETAPAAAPKADSGVYLFKTQTCPNCKAAEALLQRAGVQYQTLDADQEPELVSKYGIMQAPTLVVTENGGFKSFRGVSDITGWLAAARA